MMRVGNVDINLRHLVDQIKARKMPRRSRAPNCTHLDMDRVYGRNQHCDVCGRSPPIGFLYECRQDWVTQSLRDLLTKDVEKGVLEVVKSDMRLELECLGLSESVILTAEQGHYTRSQLEKIKTQKKELRQIISDSLQASQINDAAATLAVLAQAPSNHDGAQNSTPEKEATPACAIRACHTCRPYYRDRVHISFQSVLAADFTPMTREDADCLPTKSAKIMATIGNTRRSLHSFSTSDTAPLSLPTATSLGESTDAPPTASTSTSTASGLTFKTTQTDLDEISAQRHPRRRFYMMGHRNSKDIARDLSRQSYRLSRQGLKSALQGIFRPNRDSSSEGSNITLPVPHTGTVRNSSEAHDIGDFDLPALRKVRKEKERIDVMAGTDILTYENAPMISPIGASNNVRNEHSSNEMTTSDNVTMYSCVSRGSEVEVEGGVALTEEAVETHTPDILAIDVSHIKNAMMIHDLEMDDDEDFAADIGLQSIMTQV
ncbi:hypothetical protein HBI82_103960 [Parastagonospora nodorum]|nr:hypothetical protein HBH52_098770 [Parastagonospora nodorum]KAH4966666.1 hypothetical protein HBI78_085050 [Parastagonospora nodorum]KAH5037577.1 hypothetical protein HBI75_073180 [Parastagonospora nodorum]KAH5190503.1 hypothetical protein HBH77_158180 [Parastagonospora nodorum]KAH5305842.1 hypothetical protein HBI12_168090 [Parastagonospora nodorum]